MSIFRLITDWMEHRGPEYFDPECDEDVQYLRQKRDQAHAATAQLLRADLADTLREARRNLNVPTHEGWD